MNISHRLVILGFLATMAGAACGGDDDEGGDNEGGSGGDEQAAGESGTGGMDEGGSGGSAERSEGGSGGSSSSPASGGSGGQTGGTGGSGQGGQAGGGQGGQPGPAGVKSNTPAASFVNESAAQTGKLTLVSANVKQDKPLNSVFTNFFGEVVNDGQDTLCLIEFAITYKNAGGATLVKLDTFVDGPPYKMGALSIPTSCLAPGERGGLWTIEQGGALFALTDVKSIEYAFEALEGDDAVPHPNKPSITQDMIIEHPQFGGKAVRGQLTAKVTIHNIGLDIYAIGANGLVVDQLSDTHLETLSANTNWTFETLPAEDPFTSHLIFPSWLDGAKTVFAPAHDPVVQRLQQRAVMLERRKALSTLRRDQIEKALDLPR